MAGATNGRSVARLARIGGVFVAVYAGFASSAAAIEFLDGRVQIHGFGEVQVRALDEKFKEELDLAQWYNVINVELEFDIAPDGFGPFDLVSAYVRAEGRYDAIYSQGFGMFPSVNTFGDDAERLPLRLRDATDYEFAGQIPVTDRDGNRAHPRIESDQPVSIVPPSERVGFPGYDTFFRNRGPDNDLGPTPKVNRGIVELGRPFDDPAWYIHEKVLDYKFALKGFRGTANTSTQILGPWLPKNFIRAMALNPDVGNPFRGRVSPTKPRRVLVANNGFGFALVGQNTPESVRFFEGDPALVLAPGQTAVVDQLDPVMAAILNAPPQVFVASVMLNGTVTFQGGAQPLNTTFPAAYGGDFLGGTVPCEDPAGTEAINQRNGQTPGTGRFCIRGSAFMMPGANGEAVGTIYTDPNIFGVTKMTGGGGENPFRPAPDISNLGRMLVDDTGAVIDADPDGNGDLMDAQGQYYPSLGTRKVRSSGRLDSLNMNFDEDERSWNRGDAQQRTKELKEAYVDLELLDSRLWLRLGLQNIVWGKTELFRTTDQFNPQDLALASLPSLEESRVALWSARAVYSLYNVGPLEDVRLEVAANLDQFQPGDIGACGEPFTPDVVCTLTTGIYAHSILGIGVAGIDRPESPWKELSDMEFGGRIEWRWDRFSFALTDFYGFSDFPHTDAVFFYERNVDPFSGRPLVARLPGQRIGTCGAVNAGEPSSVGVGVQYQPIMPGDPNAVYSTAFATHPLSVTTGIDLLNGQVGKWRGGIGYDPDCLRPGGAPGAQNAFPTDFEDDNVSPLLRDDGSLVSDDIANTNALEYHYANQQIFSWICAGTVGIGAQVDPSACAWTVFSTPNTLSQATRVPLSEIISIAGAGSVSALGANSLLNRVMNSQKFAEADAIAPFVSLNRLFNDPRRPLMDRNGDGSIDATGCDSADPTVRANCDLGGFDGFDGRLAKVFQEGAGFPAGSLVRDPAEIAALNAMMAGNNTIVDTGRVQHAYQTLDNSLTNEQRALLGCGPFFGTRCDSSAIQNTLQPQPGVPQDNSVRHFALAGGLDFLNMDASALEQAWPGIEGTRAGHRTTMSLRDRMQPGTIADGSDAAGIVDGGLFRGGSQCTRFVRSVGDTVKLPGCRGIKRLTINRLNDSDVTSAPVSVIVEFEEGYLPSIDGCVIGSRVAYGDAASGTGIVPVELGIEDQSGDGIGEELRLCNDAIRESARPQYILDRSGDLFSAIVRDGDGNYVSGGVPNLVTHPDFVGLAGAALSRVCPPQGSRAAFTPVGQPGSPMAPATGVEGGVLTFRYCMSDLVRLEELPMIHPTAGCIDSEVWWQVRAEEVDPETGLPLGGCEFFYDRPLVQEFFEGKAALFQNELAAFSNNFMQFLIAASCNEKSFDLDGRNHATPNAQTALRRDPECFDAERPWTPGRCSFSTPQFCTNVKGFLSAAGVTRNVRRAGGNGAHGRRTFAWHSGGEVVLTYEQRNVLGLSMDFAEDVTKTNWGIEFTWIEDVPFGDANSFSGITFTDAYNLTVSVDRPTFINFLNPNRTFFFNSQWFFSYLPDYHHSFSSNGPVNVLFTFAVFTGYFQDRVMPQFVTVYDFNSQSGGLLPSLQYRFTEAFSVQVGMLWFFGRTQLTEMPLREIGPAANRGPQDTYENGTDNILSLVRKRDEVFMRLRWTF